MTTATDTQSTGNKYTIGDAMEILFGKLDESIDDMENGRNASINNLLNEYVEEVSKIYGEHLKSVILYGSYARGDFNENSDIDIMILTDLTDMDIEKYRRQLSWATYDFNEAHDTDIKPIAKNDTHFKKWLGVYPFYTNVQKEGIKLYGTV